eukprot:767327-Hanusia_phi.AAC.2
MACPTPAKASRSMASYMAKRVIYPQPMDMNLTAPSEYLHASLTTSLCILGFYRDQPRIQNFTYLSQGSSKLLIRRCPPLAELSEIAEEEGHE